MTNEVVVLKLYVFAPLQLLYLCDLFFYKSLIISILTLHVFWIALLTHTAYVEDDEVVPKNASLVVKRIPAKNSSTSLIARLNIRGYTPSNISGM